jgi:osmoprotectant transport system substrate-binding protein
MEILMRHARSRLLRTAAVLASVGLLAAGCGGDDTESAATTNELEGVSVTVGSKDFTENILLGEILVLALRQKGAEVTDQTNLGGTVVNRTSLLAGDIDVYPEYNGTGWTVHLGQQRPSQDPQELYDVTATMDLEENNIQWVGLSPFNDTYGFVANGDLAAAEGGFDLQGMADYLADHPEATVCLETEFPDRPDGLVLFTEGTGFTIPEDQIQILETGLIYTETSSGACDFGEVYTTDGRIQALNLSLVEDPGIFILYNVSYTWNADKFQEHADVYQPMIDAILAPLDEEKMASLNAKVDVEDESPEDVARAYLQEIGLM